MTRGRTRGWATESEEAAITTELEALFSRFFSGRAIFSAVLFYVGLRTLGVTLGQSFFICLVIYLLHIFHFGTRRVEQLSLLMLAIGVVSWAEIVPVQEIIAHAKIQTLAAVGR